MYIIISSNEVGGFVSVSNFFLKFIRWLMVIKFQ